MKLTLHVGDRVEVTDHGALDEHGQGKRRSGCIVRLLNAEYAMIYVPRYEAELRFYRTGSDPHAARPVTACTWLTPEGRLEVTRVESTKYPSKERAA